MKRILTALLALLLLSTACSDDADTAGGSGGKDTASEQTDDASSASNDEVVSEGDDDTDQQDGQDVATTTVTQPDATATDTANEGPLRIVSISPTATEILFAVGAGELVVAVDQYSYFPDEAPVTNLDGLSPNVEAIADFGPDIVVMQSSGDVQAALESLGIQVIVQDTAVSIEDTYAQIAQIGALTGHQEDADALVTQMQTEIGALIASAPDTSSLSYFHELSPTLYSVTSSTFVGAVYSLFGLQNAADPADADGSAFGYPQLSDEYLVDADPDLIFLADTICCGQTAATVAERPGWDQLSAVQNGNVIELNDDIASRWGPRIVEFIATISEAIRNL